MKTKYCEYSKNQLHSVKVELRGAIFYLLLCVDPKTKGDFANVNVKEAFDDIQARIGGFNKLLFEPPEVVRTMSLIESALMEYLKPEDEFNFANYRKLILDAGAEIMRVKEV